MDEPSHESLPNVVRGAPREARIDAECPGCGARPLLVRSILVDLPFFGEALQTVVECTACGYRHADLLPTRSREPVRVRLRITPDRLSARVVRSSSGTIRIPELGASMEPGPRAEGFVSNAEGVLRRFLDIVRGQESVASGSERGPIAAVRARIEGMIEGREPFTLVLEDPTGNSGILHEDASRETLTEEQAARLKASELVLDLSQLVPGDEGS